MSWRSRRSCLSVPATQPRFHEKAVEVPADELIFDLEDSVPTAAKERARGMVVQALRTHDYSGKVRAVRVNACDSRWCLDDVREVVEGAAQRLDCLVVPKVEGADHVHFLHHLLSQLERKLVHQPPIGLELQIESARALEDVAAIASASPRTESLVFGPGDFAASMQMPGLTIGQLVPDYPGDFWHYFTARIAVAARAQGLQAIDGPYAQVRDLEGLRTSAGRAAALGYDGKWALNPAQVELLNQTFTPAQADFDKAAAIVELYSNQAALGETGAIMLGEEMIDEASSKQAQVTVARGRSAGLRPRPWKPAE